MMLNKKNFFWSLHDKDSDFTVWSFKLFAQMFGARIEFADGLVIVNGSNGISSWIVFLSIGVAVNVSSQNIANK